MLARRYDQAVCVVSELLGWAHKTKVKNNAAPTGAHSKQLPADFEAQFAPYWRLDGELYALAGEMFDAHLDRIPKCRRA